jgi:hypothetical protein
VVGIAAHVRVRQDMPGAQDLADPALVAMEDRQTPGQLVGESGPRRDLEDIVMQDADRGCVGAQGAFGLIDDHVEEVGPIVRGGKSPGDPEDCVEAFGEFGLEGAARRSGCARLGVDGDDGAGREVAPVGTGQSPHEGASGRDR